MEMRVVSIKCIVIKPDRGRKEFPRIQEMAESIKKNGFIHPICVTNAPDRPGYYELIAGERRYRGAVIAGLTELPITFRENMTELQQKVMELEENACRVELNWQEQAELHRQIDEHKRQDDPSWMQKDTAQLLGLSNSHINLQLKAAQKLRDNPELKEEIRNLPINAAMQVIERREQVDRVDRLSKAGRLQITTDLRCGDARDLIKQLPDHSIDLLLCDPPYGLEKLEALRNNSGGPMSGHAMMGDDHNQSIENVLKLMTELAPQFHRVLKPGAHFYVFCAVQYIGDFIRALVPLEFMPPAVVWDRGKSTTPGYGYNYLGSLEYIIYGYNPPRSRRLAKNLGNLIEHPEVPKNLRVYPTEKPQGLLKVLIEQSSIMDEVVLDPFAGSASTLKAARALGRKSIGFEKNPDSWKRAQLILSGQIDALHAQGLGTQGSLLPDETPEAMAESAEYQA